MDIALNSLSQIVRRDVTSDEHVGARDAANGFLAALLNSREFDPEQKIQARSLWSVLGSFLRRDVAPDELAARDNMDDLMKLLNTRELNLERKIQSRGFFTNLIAFALNHILTVRLRDVSPDELAGRDNLDDAINAYISNSKPTAREHMPEQEIQARSSPDDTPKTVARDGTMNDFINALMKTRDSPEITTEDALTLASLASRALDDLD